MRETIQELCVLSVFCGAALRLAPEGAVRRVTSVLCTAVLLLCVLGGIRALDFDSYALEQGILREQEQRFRIAAEESRQRLDRLVIEQELQTYIQNKAEQRGLRILELETGLTWRTEGLWIPHALSVSYAGPHEQAERLAEELEAELGVPRERQRWSEYGADQEQP